MVGLLLLLPAVLSFFVDQYVQRRQTAAMSARAVPYQPKPNFATDTALFAACGLIASSILVIIGMAFFASIAKLWPYDLTVSLKNYDFDNMDGGGWQSFFNSLRMAGLTAVFGTAIVFIGAYLVEDDAGGVAPAAAMAMTIFFAAMVVRAVYTLLVRGVLTRTQAWRRR